MAEEDVDGLRRAEFSDQQITIATQVIGYFNYINRIADALQVDPESWMDSTIESWQSRKGDFARDVRRG